MLSSEQLDGILFIRCETDIVYEKAEDFKFRLDRLLNGEGLKVVLDLEAARYLCSSAIGAIASGCSRLRQSGGDLVLMGLTTELSRLLVVTRLADVIQIAGDRDQAQELLHITPEDSGTHP